MFERLIKTLVLGTLALALVPASAAHAQDGGRFRVLVPYFEPLEGADDDFGKDASKELRSLMDGLATHRAISEGDIKDEVKEFGTHNMWVEDEPVDGNGGGSQ